MLQHQMFKARIPTFFFGSNNVGTITLLIYKIILKHQENEIHQFLKEGQMMVCFILFWRRQCVNLKKIGLIFFTLQFIQTQSVYD